MKQQNFLKKCKFFLGNFAFAKCVLLAFLCPHAVAENAQENMLAQIENYILSAYRTNYEGFDFALEKIEISMPKNNFSHKFSQGKIKKLTLQNNATKKTSGTLIATIALEDSKSVVSVPISYHIVASIGIAQAKMLIKSGADITSENAFINQVPLSQIKGNPLPAEQIGQVSARSLIAPNSIITRDKIQARILVRKGDKIIGIYKAQSMQAQIELKAMQNGAKGNIIKAQNLQSGKILQVKITDDGIGEIL